MRNIKKKCGCNLWEYDLNEILTGKVKPNNSVYCLKHKKEIATRAGLICKQCGELYDTCLCTKKGKGWHGNTPGHKEASLKGKAREANNMPMVKTSQPDELYHTTFKSKSSKLLKEGIIPKKSSTYKNRAGGELKDSGTIYAFSNFDDAVRWASKMQFDFKKPTIIVAFRGNISEWGIDTHWQSAGAKGKWLKKKRTISPEDIIELIGISQKMTQAVVQTGGTSKELTRMNGIMEMT